MKVAQRLLRQIDFMVQSNFVWTFTVHTENAEANRIKDHENMIDACYKE